MSNKADRGTKRTCQECEARFYDLDREPITCPICGVVFKLEDPDPVSVQKVKAAPVAPVVVKKVAKDTDNKDESDPVEDELAEIESDDTKSSTDDDDNTFLETEDDDTNVSDMLGTPVAKGEQES